LISDHDAHSLANNAERAEHRSPRKSPRRNVAAHSLANQTECAERPSPSKNMDFSFSIVISRPRSQNWNALQFI